MIDSFQKSLERFGQGSFMPHNSVRILKDGGSTFKEVFRAVWEAKRLICLEFYIFRDDRTGPC